MIYRPLAQSHLHNAWSKGRAIAMIIMSELEKDTVLTRVMILEWCHLLLSNILVNETAHRTVWSIRF